MSKRFKRRKHRDLVPSLSKANSRKHSHMGLTLRKLLSRESGMEDKETDMSEKLTVDVDTLKVASYAIETLVERVSAMGISAEDDWLLAEALKGVAFMDGIEAYLSKGQVVKLKKTEEVKKDETSDAEIVDTKVAPEPPPAA